MDRHRDGDRPGSGGGDRTAGGGGGDHVTGGGGDLPPRRMPSSRWSGGGGGGGGGSPTNDHHRFNRGGGGGSGGRFHPYRTGQDFAAGGGQGFRDGPRGGGFQVPMGGPKRGFFGRGGGSPEYTDGNKFVKLFVGSVPRTVTEEDIRPLFEEHGNVIEVALIRDRRSGQQQGFCFVKYATSEEADRAIAALHNQNTLPGALAPLQVRYADSDRERHEDKLFVASLNKRATEQEISEIFAPYGHVEEVYLMRDDLKQSRGCGFVKFSNREMAAAAMNSLHGTYVMRGCDQPLIVRFADPKRPRPEPRGGPAFGGPGFGHHSETTIGPNAKFDEPIGGRTPPSAWGQVSPQSRGPSSQGTGQGYGNNPSAKGGAMETSSVATGLMGETGGRTGVHQSNFAATSSQQVFNPSMSQIHPVLGQQMPPLQKPLMTPQHMPHSLQPLQNQQISDSHPQGQSLQPPMQPLGQFQVPTGLTSSQTQLSQLPGLSGQLSASQPLIQPNASATGLQTPLGVSQQGMSAIVNQQQLPSSTISQQLLQRPSQQMPAQFPQVLLQQQAQALQTSYQSSQQAIFQLQQQLQMMQQQHMSQNAKQQQSPWCGPQPTSVAHASAPDAVMPSAASVTSSLPGATITIPTPPLTCNWTEHTSPQGFKYYYNNVTGESKWEKPEEFSVFEQQQQQQQQKLLLYQQQQQKLATQQLQSPAQTQPQTQIQINQQIPQAQQVHNPMQLRQQAQQMQLLQPSFGYQAPGAGSQQNIQDFNYVQLQAANSVTDTARAQQGMQAAQELSWQNKPSGT